MEGVSSPAVGLNYDVANFLKIGVDPLIALRKVLGWVRYTHWKDVRWAQNRTGHCAVGEDEVHWEPIVAELKRARYAGYRMIEYESPQDVEKGHRGKLACAAQIA